MEDNQMAITWEELKSKLPFTTRVAYNYSGSRHTATYLSGADHIITMEPMKVGRINREARRALCETPSRSRHLLFELSGGTHLDPDTPSCKRCIEIAAKVLGINTPIELERTGG